jgi:hypothetical protein
MFGKSRVAVKLLASQEGLTKNASYNLLVVEYS